MICQTLCSSLNPEHFQLGKASTVLQLTNTLRNCCKVTNKCDMRQTIRFLALADPRGGALPARARLPPPQWDPIVSFSHTFSPQSTRAGGWCPPMARHLPPTENPGSATVLGEQ